MKENWFISVGNEIGESDQDHPEVIELMERLDEIAPHEMAQALYHIESLKEFPQLFNPSLLREGEESRIYFSRGLKQEIESIYLELAKHLRCRSNGSIDLMNAVFDFLGKTLASFLEVPSLISMN